MFRRFAPARENFIPKGSRKVASKTSDAVVYVHDYVGPNGKVRYSAMAFAGRAQKPVFHYYYTTSASREAKIKEFFAGQAARKEMKQRYKDETKAKTAEAVANRKVGDIYVETYGYNMTLNNFYQVVGLVGKQSVEVREIGSIVVDGDAGYQGTEIPAIDSFMKDAKTTTRRIVDGRIATDHRGARLWDGEPCRFNRMD